MIEKSKDRERLNQRLDEYIADMFGDGFDLWAEQRRIAQVANATKGNRNGDNRESYIGEKYMRYQPINEEDAKAKLHQIKIYLGLTDLELDTLWGELIKKNKYSLFRHCYSQMSPAMRVQHFGKEHEAPVNNGRQTLGIICSVFALAEISKEPSEARDIKSFFYKRWKNYTRAVEGWCDHNKNGIPHKRLTTYNHLMKIGKDKTGTVRIDKPIKKRTRKKVTNINLQHTRARALEVKGNTVIADIALK